jgi:putative SOS response-associated peptidase YedK
MTVLIQQFQLGIGMDRQLPLRFNVAPTQDIPVVRQTEEGRELAIVRWGLTVVDERRQAKSVAH